MSESPEGVVRLADLVTYQEGSVVSRTIVKNAAGTVTVFAFDEGQALSEHTAAFDALVQVLEGEVEVVVGGAAHQLSEGDAILMPANVPHAVNAVSRFKMLLTMLKG
jgi:quercetin dioxygenase-like cupin family protein